MTVQFLLDSDGLIQRYPREQDGQGGWKKATTPTDVGLFLCRISSASGRDVEIAGQHQAVVTHAIYFDAGIDARIGDRITISGRIFDVRVGNAAGNHPYVKVLAQEYQRG